VPMALNASAPVLGPRLTRGVPGPPAGCASASSAARARVIPQWQASARCGTRRPQEGQSHECAVGDPTIRC
jgi:hypothetical protein